jgi:DnaJ-class molecular chaperone
MEDNPYRKPRPKDDREVEYCGPCWGTGKLEMEMYHPDGIQLALAICGSCGGSGIRGYKPTPVQ